MGLLQRIWVAFGFGEQPPIVGADGLVDWVRMDAEDFRSKCAVWADGRCILAEGYEGDPNVREILLGLRHSGAVPDMLRERRGTLDEVAAAWRGGEEVRGSRMADPEKEQKLYRILEQAIAAEADDIVLERGETDCRVFVIVNNRKLPLVTPITAAEGDWIVNYLFYCKHPGSRQSAVVQQEFQGWGVGSGELRMPEKIAALRVERGPDVNGEHMVIRMFAKGRVSEDMTLEKLGFSAEVSEIFREIRASRYGGVIVAGPTGEGKSTTNTVNLITQMKEHGGELNMATVEDPVESPIRGALQIQVPPTGVGEDRSKHYRKALMHFIRMHPQVGGVGEIRDVESAKQVLQFVDSGHQIWTTLHAHSANGILFRLLDLGVPRAQLTKPGNARLLLRQSLVSVLCAACALDAPAEGRRLPLWLAARVSAETRYRNPAGCKVCLAERGTDLARLAWAGYANRVAFAEWIAPDEGYLAFVGENDVLGAWKYWLEEMGGVTVGTRIWRAVADGLVDPFDALAKGAGRDEADRVLGRPRSGLTVVAGDGEQSS